MGSNNELVEIYSSVLVPITLKHLNTRSLVVTWMKPRPFIWWTCRKRLEKSKFRLVGFKEPTCQTLWISGLQWCDRCLGAEWTEACQEPGDDCFKFPFRYHDWYRTAIKGVSTKYGSTSHDFTFSLVSTPSGQSMMNSLETNTISSPFPKMAVHQGCHCCL